MYPNSKLTAVFFLVFANFAFAQNNIQIPRDIQEARNRYLSKVDHVDHNSITYFDSARGTSKEIFRDRRFYLYGLAHRGKTVAGLGLFEDSSSVFLREYHRIPNLLVVADTSGEILLKQVGVTEFNLSKDGEKVAFIQGAVLKKYPSESLMGSSLYIYDIDKRALSQVVTNGYFEILFHAEWADFDGNLYFEVLAKTGKYTQRGVFVYNPSRGSLEATPYYDIHFSPDGKYYYQPSYEGEVVKMYLRETNEEIPIIIQTPLLEKSILDFLKFNHWEIVNGTTYAVFDHRPLKRSFRFNCSNGHLTSMD